MRIRLICAVLFVMMSGWVTQSAAQGVLFSQSYDTIYAVRDPSEAYVVSLAFNSLTPVTVRFDGFFRHMESGEFGLIYYLQHLSADGSGYEEPFYSRIRGFAQLPMAFELTIPFTPAEIIFGFHAGSFREDQSRFVGQFSIQQVPEPGSAALFCIAGYFLFGLTLRNRRCIAEGACT